ncbi:hypothetical protein C0995_007478 [Termitomyces sp. Mi166|nr:hypothetical protein C0995_007478 [Termitomyces sp. Mi166\
MSSAPPAVPPVVLGTGNNILVNPLQAQRGNSVLDNIKNVGKEFSDIVVDYQVGRTTGVLFLRSVLRSKDGTRLTTLSLKYHRLHPEYIHIRIEKLGHSYTLRILLVLCDIVGSFSAVKFEEAGHYLATLKQFEHKPPDMIKERVDKDYNSILRTALTSISKVNKTDVETLHEKSFANIGRATPDQLRNLPGFGQVKVRNIKNTFDKPLRNNATRTMLPIVPSQSIVGGLEVTADRPQPSDSTPITLTISTEGKERPPREPSPVWDIELDESENGPPPESLPHPFDIDLDLN